MDASAFEFYERLPIFDRFADVGDTARYVPLPAGWRIGVADVENSAKVIAEGRYKTVNTVGAAVVAALMNALGTRSFPFAFGGDGASIAVPPEFADTAADALARVRRFADSLDLALRVGLVPIEAIRAAGHDVRVARLGVSPEISFALFAGGGVHWAEAELKAGRIGLPDAASGTWPDLAGLSCRWAPIAARNGRILSLITVPAPGASDANFAKLVERITAIVEAAPDRGVPVSAEKMSLPLVPKGIAIEAARDRLDTMLSYAKLLAISAMGWAIFKGNRRVGAFDPVHYKERSILNSDFRKYNDGLRMTLDAGERVEDEIRAVLEEAHRAGTAFYGIYAQDAALMTCLVPSVLTDDHMHFIDGAAGGYARAAAMLKQQAAAGV